MNSFVCLFKPTCTIRVIDFFLSNPRNDFSMSEIIIALRDEVSATQCYRVIDHLKYMGFLNMTLKSRNHKKYSLDFTFPGVYDLITSRVKLLAWYK